MVYKHNLQQNKRERQGVNIVPASVRGSEKRRRGKEFTFIFNYQKVSTLF